MSCLSDIATAEERARRVELLGFGGTDRQTQQTLFEFRREIGELQKNLRRLGETIWEADQLAQTGQLRSQIPGSQWTEDLLTLNQICGDYSTTLARCESYLQRSSGSGQDSDARRDSVIHISCGTSSAEVNTLTTELYYHNVKMRHVLEPLKSQLVKKPNGQVGYVNGEPFAPVLANDGLVKQEMSTYVDDLGICRPASSVYESNVLPQLAAPRVPASIEKLFAWAARLERPDLFSNAASFPLQIGTDAFVRHLEASTKIFRVISETGQHTPPPMRYINLLKCAWLIQNLNFGCMTQTHPTSLWRKYIEKLEVELWKQFDRFTSNTPERERLYEPPVNDMLQLPAEYFGIWTNAYQEKQTEIRVEPMVAPDTLPERQYMPEMLNLTLSDSSNDTEHRLLVLDRGDSAIRIIDSLEYKRGASSRTVIQKYDVSTAQTVLTPLYANPASSADALHLKFRDVSQLAAGVCFSFRKVIHLMKFQHCLTGHYVAFDRSFESSQVLVWQRGKQDSRPRASGRLQLWIPKKLEGKLQDPEPPSTADSGNGSRTTLTPEVSPLTGVFSSPRSYAPSIASQMTSPLTGCGGLSTTMSVAPSARDGTGILWKKPKEPLLVFFLQDTGGVYSFLVLKVDGRTFVNKQACNCRNDEPNCSVCVIEQADGPLNASRYCTTRNLDEWNLAALSTASEDTNKVGVAMFSQGRPPAVEVERGLKWVKVTFKNVKDRRDFSGSPCSCRCKDESPLDSCRQKHRGILGEAQLSFLKKLQRHCNRDRLPHLVGTG